MHSGKHISSAHGAANGIPFVQVTGNAEISNLLQIMGPLAQGWPFRVVPGAMGVRRWE